MLLILDLSYKNKTYYSLWDLTLVGPKRLIAHGSIKFNTPEVMYIFLKNNNVSEVVYENHYEMKSKNEYTYMRMYEKEIEIRTICDLLSIKCHQYASEKWKLFMFNKDINSENLVKKDLFQCLPMFGLENAKMLTVKDLLVINLGMFHMIFSNTEIKYKGKAL